MTARQVRVCPVMGTVASIHVIGRADAVALEHAVDGAFGLLRRADRVFSMYDEQSDIRRIARGELTVAAADPWVREVSDACDGAEFETRGLFSAHLGGAFDPTGCVKGWAAERALREHLAPLLSEPAVQAVGLDVGGDLQVLTAESSDWTWNIGIVDPTDRTRVLATVPVRNGAVATSGSAERGAHIIDPRTGRPATGIRSATVIAPGLTRADVWATAAVVAGDDLSWISRAPDTSGLLVDDAGGVHRWIAGVTVDVQPA
ncbi:FAD:protein FMN transferase [uncultured Microbacterium sp.]|uniref:FAD:protein FMN transferase n=1 Tax=uncultured Microbacterium sp. TaxID=191216 RepID=UPI00263047BF|nr:FAD:protein FMN transferase [uncultured Microbacterium sp.]